VTYIQPAARPGLRLAYWIIVACSTSSTLRLFDNSKRGGVAERAIYLAYELAVTNITGQSTVNEIRFTRSLDGGNTFSAPQIVSTTVNR
jgi:hypothetical protein